MCLLTAFTAAPVRADLDDDLARMEKQVELLEGKARLIRQEYLQFKGERSTGRRFEERLNDGQALMLLKDYVRAAIVFHNLVQNGTHQDLPGYADALYSLGEALYFNRNFIDARKYYRKVLEDPRGRPYRKVAMVRLMQIALRIRDFDQVDGYHERLRMEGGGISPEGEYLWGKTLYARDRLDGAAEAFGSLSPGQSFYLQSRYFLGVIQVRNQELEQALELFDALSGQPAGSAKDGEVIELAHLARGRILHDLGREAGALDAFQAVEHTSPHFDDALLEICWTYVQRAEKAEQLDERNRWFLEAFRTLEILEVSTPDSTFIPRAHLLKGHILQKMGRFDDAAEVFSMVSSTYATVKQELDELVASHDDAVQYFNEIAGRNLETFDLTAYIPPVAVRWMTRQDEMSVSLDVMKDLQTGRRFVTEARSLLKQLDALLDSEKDRINLFPLLREGAKRTIEVENARVIAERNLSRFEKRVVMEYVSANEHRAFEQVRKERKQLEDKLDDLPTNQKETATREERVRDRIQVLDQAVYQSTIGLKGMKAQLSAMEEWLRQHKKELEGREEAVRDFREEIRRGWAMANQLQAELDALAGQLAIEKARAGLDAEAQTKEEQLRRRYSEALAKERALAQQIHDRLGSEGAARISRINRLRLRSEKLRNDLGRIREGLDQRVEEEAEKLKEQALAEKKNLDEYEVALARLEKESKNLAGKAAYRALDDVRQKFYRLVLDADVGVLDVAWSRKMKVTRKITDLARKQGAERKRLHEEFKGVLKEVD